ncbi:MAG TPA: 3' terminal RNA ribose 2'-O-methyltransferase Hen1 [Streptosporangiaceae bacterium]
MLLTIATTHRPATDLGFLLHKHPDREHAAPLSFGTAHLFYPQASAERCCAAILLQVDPVGLVRDTAGPASPFALGGYVNDRPYAASSFLSVALAKLLGTAMSGRSKERPELAGQPIALEIGLPVLPCRGGPALLRALFEPLGYAVTARPIPLDGEFPDWGDSRYLAVTLEITARLQDVLEQVYVLIPVLDDDKHYWAGEAEVGKLLRRGGRWLAAHPDRELIAERYLRHDRRLTRDALARLVADEGGDPDRADADADAAEQAAEHRIGLHQRRITAVTRVIAASGARRVLDLGCGSGQLIAELLRSPAIDQVTGVDVSHRALAGAARRLRLDTASPRELARVELLHGALTYRDDRLRGFDAAVLMEVIEHIDPPRLAAAEQAVFGWARPAVIAVTTPNAEYNALFTGLSAGELRHGDHRFEWSRAQFGRWAGEVAARHGYRAELSGIGPADAAAGAPTQLAVFRR